MSDAKEETWTIAAAGAMAEDRSRYSRQLTQREDLILRLLADDKSTKEISKILGVKERSVRESVGKILAKLGVQDESRAVVRAIDLGIIGPRRP